jgi:antitoxin YefM
MLRGSKAKPLDVPDRRAGSAASLDRACGQAENKAEFWSSGIREGAMKTLSLSEAKMKLSALVDEVHRTDQEVVITRNGVPVAVLVSPDELESWRETVAIRLDEESLSEIREGLAALDEGQASLYTLEELFEG